MGTIKAGRDGGGYRDFLDDRPIHAGDILEIYLFGQWRRARYESNVRLQIGYLYLDDETFISLSGSRLQCRWPE